MLNSSCATLAAGSDEPASDQSCSPCRSRDCGSLRVVGRQSARRAEGHATGDRACLPSHRASAGNWCASPECPACGCAACSSESSSLPSVLPRSVQSCGRRDSRALAHEPRHQPARVTAAAPNPPLDRTAGMSCRVQIEPLRIARVRSAPVFGVVRNKRYEQAMA